MRRRRDRSPVLGRKQHTRTRQHPLVLARDGLAQGRCRMLVACAVGTNLVATRVERKYDVLTTRRRRIQISQQEVKLKAEEKPREHMKTLDSHI